MATISKRTGKGGVRYTAQIRLRREGVAVSESRTFPKLAEARAWAARREAELASPEAMDAARHRGVTLGELFTRYLAEVCQGAEFGRTKRLDIRALAAQDELAHLPAVGLRAADILAHCSRRRAVGAQPQTIQGDLIWIRVVLRHARSAWGVPVPLEQVEEAIHTARAARLIARSQRRERRPTAEELATLSVYFRDRCRSGMPMLEILWLAIYTGRRLDELFRLRLEDADRAHGVWRVRDLKHPGGARGNDAVATVPPLAWEVVAALEAAGVPGEGRLLPFNARSVGTVFARAVRLLGIADLHFHDLRHEACSRLAEDGRTIPEIQRVSLHESWGSLSRYVQLPPIRWRRVEWREFV